MTVDQAVNSFVIANGLNKKGLWYLLLSYTLDIVSDQVS